MRRKAALEAVEKTVGEEDAEDAREEVGEGGAMKVGNQKTTAQNWLYH